VGALRDANDRYWKGGSAAKVRSRTVSPLDWATIQNNLGNALGTLGRRESGTAKLEEAVTAIARP
jgi:hypothetical protein